MQQVIDKNKSFEDRISFLRKCAKTYENSGNSPISDSEYDEEYYALQAINPDDSFFDEVGGLDEVAIRGKLVTHKVTMGSLNKSKNIEDFEEWFKNTYGDQVVTVVVQHKIDGLSLSCHYKDGKLVQALTRGDGEKGVDVTANANEIASVPKTISDRSDREVRGECCKNRQDFYKIWAPRGYKNPRSFAAGAVNQKDPGITKERKVDFVAYEEVTKSFPTEIEKIQWLQAQGFEMFVKGSSLKITGNYRKIAAAVKKYMDAIDRPNLPYDIDGVVVKLDDVAAAKNQGATNGGRRPRANRAVKFPPEQKLTVVRAIEETIGRTGLLSLVGLLKPVELAGTTVKRVSLHNPRYLREKGIGKGSEVLLQKSGDIIPYIVEVRSKGTEWFKIPHKCPACGSDDFEWTDSDRITKICKNDNCSAQVNSKIEHWFKTIGVKGIGPGIISKLTSKKIDIPQDLFSNPDGGSFKLVSTVSDVYKVAAEQIDVLKDSFGDKSAENLRKSLAGVPEITLAKMIEAIGIGQVGSMAREIVAVFPTIKDIDGATVADIEKIDGFAETKARLFINGWKANRDQIKDLTENCITIREDKKASNKLEGQKYCFTGSFVSPSRGEMEQMVEEHGGKKGGVSKTLTALVWDGQMRGGKYKKACDLKIPVIGQDDFLKLIQ